MTGEPGAKGAPHPSTDEHSQEQDVLGLEERDRDYLLAYVGEHLTLVRQTASGQRPMYWILGIGFVMGLAAHAGGFLLKTSVTTEPLALLADLLSITADRYPLSRRIRTLRAILDKLVPQPVREPLLPPPPKVYAPPRAKPGQRRR